VFENALEIHISAKDTTAVQLIRQWIFDNIKLNGIRRLMKMTSVCRYARNTYFCRGYYGGSTEPPIYP
jgi:hypothetical protein